MKRCAVVPAIIVMLAAGAARAGDKQEAKKHFLEGRKLAGEGHYEEAVEELRKSYKLNPIPVVLYNIAVCYDELKEYVEAVSYYSRFLDSVKYEPDKKKKIVFARIEELNGLIGTLELEVDVEGAEVLVDGEAAGRTPLGAMAVESGHHKIVIRKDGYREHDGRFVIVPGETTSLEVELEVLGERKGEEDGGEGAVRSGEPGRRKAPPAAFWSLLGAACAAAIVPAVTGSLAIEKNEEVKKTPEGEARSLIDERRRLALTTDVCIGVSASLAVATLVLAFFTDFKKERGAKAFLLPGFSGPVLELHF